MTIEYENNSFIFSLGLLLFTLLYLGASFYVRTPRVKRIARVSIVYWGFPLVHLSHPILFYQTWMVIPISFQDGDYSGLGTAVVIWFLIVALFEGVAALKNRERV